MEKLFPRMAALADSKDAYNIEKVLTDVYDELRSVTFNSAGLVISGTGGKVAKTGASTTYLVTKGVLQSIAAGTSMAALVGTVANATFNVFVLSIDSLGNFYSTMGKAGSTLGAVTWPNVASSQTILGFIIVNPTGTGSFVGGTTALDDATVVPNAVYVSPIGTSSPGAALR